MISGKKISSQRELIMNKVNIPSPVNGMSTYSNGNPPHQQENSLLQQTRFVENFFPTASSFPSFQSIVLYCKTWKYPKCVRSVLKIGNFTRAAQLFSLSPCAMHSVTVSVFELESCDFLKHVLLFFLLTNLQVDTLDRPRTTMSFITEYRRRSSRSSLSPSSLNPCYRSWITTAGNGRTAVRSRSGRRRSIRMTF